MMKPAPQYDYGKQRMSWATRWLPVILWAIVISLFSTYLFTANNTGRFIIPILHWIFPDASPQLLARMHFFIRKSGHFTEYFVLSLLILRGIRAGRKEARLVWAAVALLAVAGYASLDEFHQRFVPGRTAAVSDVVLDTTGGAFAQLAAGLVLLVAAARERRKTAAGN
jgi:VanZ family protein